MGMTVQRRKDTRMPRVLMHRIADIRGGVSVNSSELGADWLPEGAVISRPVDGICHAVKTARVTAAVAESGKTVTVAKGSLFKAGDIALASVGGKAVKITAIDRTGKTEDKITLDAALGAIEAGGFLAEAAEAVASDAALKHEPFAVVGTGKPVLPNQNIDTDAWLIGVTKGNALPECVSAKLTGIINY